MGAPIPGELKSAQTWRSEASEATIRALPENDGASSPRSKPSNEKLGLSKQDSHGTLFKKELKDSKDSISIRESPLSPQSAGFDHKPSILRTNTSTSDLESRDHEATRRKHDWRPWKGHRRRIVLICALIFVPMTAFTILTLWLIFAHLIQETACPYPELCPDPSSFNGTDRAAYYIVDFPAAQLVFIASWSSTVSFSLISTVMAIHAYTAARQFLSLSDNDQSTTSEYPTPYQTGLMIRLLNAELMTLWSMFCHTIKDTFWRKKASVSGRRNKAPVVRTSLFIFVAALVGR